ncbi:hypothetical protein LTR56_015682 [Elasticomyces elasticus]|nr:hypothetical protein LTR22_022250 [Elasticomyces elasticus]KAK3633768.1 hypothetical protein LTR56_015682 [Elasticomyces elasticus]KAK4914567.1 hypothetical protein LTR49_017260 [Elasticomyces elasticus]KAK5754392.1 hypothetical protein LTS12_015570 [Elasticomyces elasticus]
MRNGEIRKFKAGVHVVKKRWQYGSLDLNSASAYAKEDSAIFTSSETPVSGQPGTSSSSSTDVLPQRHPNLHSQLQRVQFSFQLSHPDMAPSTQKRHRLAIRDAGRKPHDATSVHRALYSSMATSYSLLLKKKDARKLSSVLDMQISASSMLRISNSSILLLICVTKTPSFSNTTVNKTPLSSRQHPVPIALFQATNHLQHPFLPQRRSNLFPFLHIAQSSFQSSHTFNEGGCVEHEVSNRHAAQNSRATAVPVQHERAIHCFVLRFGSSPPSHRTVLRPVHIRRLIIASTITVVVIGLVVLHRSLGAVSWPSQHIETYIDCSGGAD